MYERCENYGIGKVHIILLSDNFFHKEALIACMQDRDFPILLSLGPGPIILVKFIRRSAKLWKREIGHVFIFY